MVLIAGAGMLSGGRITHHLKAFGPDRRSTVLLTGYQAAGTRGASLLGGAKHLKIHGQEVPIRAEVASMDGLSAHADQSELLDWLQAMPTPPRQVWLVHGEPSQADTLRHAIEHKLRLNTRVAEDHRTVTLE
jgi:metallo-beta-lactamase family protein